MQNRELDKTLSAWPSVAENIFVPHTEEQYGRMVALLDRLVDEVGEDETHPYASLMELLSVLIEHYESEHVPELTIE
ncbi:MAG: HTH-type transcriptional regulator / antitoxin HigA [Pyrinomonadaceae bacterium]|nr:HTH-type transcriptional regulator / antitoxin HigA [Pyrinomonadaceae bacterium]